MAQAKTAAQIVAEERGISVQEAVEFLKDTMTKERGIYFETFDVSSSGDEILHTHTVATNLALKMLLDKLGLRFTKEKGTIVLKEG